MCEALNSHDVVIDEREGTEVCIRCGLVVSNQLMLPQSNFLKKPIITNKCIYHQFIMESCHKMFIIDEHAEKSYMCFNKLSSKICDKTIDKYAIASYSIYHTLKSLNSQRSLKTVSEYTGISMKMLWIVERHLIAKPKPTKAVNFLISKYRHLGLSEKDLSFLIKLSEHNVDRSFSPNSLSATYVIMYCKFQGIKMKLSTVSTIFQVSSMSIYRCEKYLKTINFNCILRDVCSKNTINDDKEQ